MRRSGELGALLALTAIGWGANQFAPLVVVYQVVADVDAAAAQGMFVLYAVGLIPGLFVGGPLSDRFGRRIVVLVSLGLSLTSATLLLLGALDTSWLYSGRLFAGFASGAGFSAGTAWVKEVAAGGTGPRRAVIAMTSGFAIGPAASGLAAATLPHPTVSVYIPHVIITAVAVVLVLSSRGGGPVGARTSTGAGGPRSPRWTVTRDPRFLLFIAPVALWVFTTASVALAVLPGAVDIPGDAGQRFAFLALVTPIPAGAGILIQPLVRHLDHRLTTQVLTGFGFGVSGYLVGAWAVLHDARVGVFIAAVLLGSAYGFCQTIGLTEIARLSPPDRLGLNTALYQSITYVGYMIPLPVVILMEWFSLPGILIGLAALATLTCVLVAVYSRRQSA